MYKAPKCLCLHIIESVTLEVIGNADTDFRGFMETKSSFPYYLVETNRSN